MPPRAMCSLMELERGLDTDNSSAVLVDNVDLGVIATLKYQSLKHDDLVFLLMINMISNVPIWTSVKVEMILVLGINMTCISSLCRVARQMINSIL